MSHFLAKGTSPIYALIPCFLPPLGTNCISHLPLSVFSTFLMAHFLLLLLSKLSYPSKKAFPWLFFFLKLPFFIFSPCHQNYTNKFLFTSLSPTQCPLFHLCFFFFFWLQLSTFSTTIIALYSRRKIGFGFDRLGFGFLLCVTLDRLIRVCFPYL